MLIVFYMSTHFPCDHMMIQLTLCAIQQSVQIMGSNKIIVNPFLYAVKCRVIDILTLNIKGFCIADQYN